MLRIIPASANMPRCRDVIRAVDLRQNGQAIRRECGRHTGGYRRGRIIEASTADSCLSTILDGLKRIWPYLAKNLIDTGRLRDNTSSRPVNNDWTDYPCPLFIPRRPFFGQ